MNLEEKILVTNIRIQQWYEHYDGKVFIAFSGGKDSTVLLHLVRKLYPDVLAVFCNTGLEYPEIVEFAESFPNVETTRPKKSFVKVLKEDGFPLAGKQIASKLHRLAHPAPRNFKTRRLALTGYVSKTGEFNRRSRISNKWLHFVGSDVNLTDECCKHLKKDPVRTWTADRKAAGLPALYPFLGLMLGEGSTRDVTLMGRECNSFESRKPNSVPLKFWTTEDVWEYIKQENLEICSVYKDLNIDRTGCTFCAYGAEREKGDNRFVKMKESHPKQFTAFIHKFGMNKALDYAGISYGEEPTHTPPVVQSYECASCKKSYTLYDVAFATERRWTLREDLEKPPTAGMDLYCRECAIKLGLPNA